jgi:hypothetical protein
MNVRVSKSIIQYYEFLKEEIYNLEVQKKYNEILTKKKINAD